MNRIFSQPNPPQLGRCAMRHAPCAMRHAPCAMRHAPCAMRHAPCAMRHAPCAMRHAPCAMRHAPCAMRRALVTSLLMGLIAGCSSKNEPPILLTVPGESLNFGTVWESDRFGWTLPVHNPSDAQVEITGFSKSCTCVSIQPERCVLAAGETRNVELMIDLSPLKLDASESEIRNFELEIAPIVSASVRTSPTLPWRVRGSVKHRIIFSIFAGSRLPL